MKRLLKITACVASLALAVSCMMPALAATTAADGTSKDENVYVILNADGTVQKQIVSDWLHNDGGLSGYQDQSSLADITTIKGDATAAVDGTNVVWTTTADDVYYQGTTTATPPVTAAITYTLDGSEMTADKLVGQSGHLVIKIALTNNEKQNQTIDGKVRTIYTPFATVVAADLPADTFSNLKAENGTVQTDSSNQLVAFLAMPGMKESLSGLLTGDLSKLDDLLLDEVTIEADVKNFEMPTILISSATSMEKLKETTDLSGVSGKLDELTDGTQKLAEATATLDSKMSELSSGYSTFDAGLDSAYTGAQKVQSGTAALLTGAQSLAAGTTTLQEGSSTLASTLNTQLVPQLAEAAKLQSRLQSDMGTLNTKLAALQTGTVTLPPEAVTQVTNAVTPAVSSAFGTVGTVAATTASTMTVSSIVSGLSTQLAAAQKQSSDAQAAVAAATSAVSTATAAVASAQGKLDADTASGADETTITSDNGVLAAARDALSTASQSLATYQSAAIQAGTAVTVLTQAIASIQASAADPAQQKAMANAVNQAVTSDAGVQAAGKNIGDTVTGAVNAAAPSVVQQIVGGLQGDLTTVNTESTQLMDGMNKLTSALYNAGKPADTTTVVGAANAIAAGASSVSGGAQQISSGAATLNSGASDLATGLKTLSSSSKTIKDAIGQFKSGTTELAAGAATLNNGVSNMSGAETLKNLSTVNDVAVALRDRADSYTSYTGSAAGTKASVKFVMKVEGPKTDETETVKQETQAAETTFWDRVKNLFK